jgi:hypothetical protein
MHESVLSVSLLFIHTVNTKGHRWIATGNLRTATGQLQVNPKGNYRTTQGETEGV